MNKANQEVRKIENSTEFNPNDWMPFLEASCYSYVLDLKENKFLLVGELTGNTCVTYTPTEVLIGVLINELRTVFNYDVIIVNLDFKVKEGERKIYFQRDRTGNYHFLREDKDGTWSHKYPGSLPTNLDEDGNVIKDPTKVDGKWVVEEWCFLLRKRESI